MREVRMAGAVRSVAAAFFLTAFAASAGLVARSQRATEGARPNRQSMQALFLSDIHFEPFWDPAKVERLAAAPVADWKSILAEPDAADQPARFAQLQQACHMRGEDTSYALLASSLAAMRVEAAGSKLVIVSGDLISHDFSCKYATLFPRSAPPDYRAFAEKTLDFVLASLRDALPNTPVYTALGNNDSSCGDYQLDPDSSFLSAEARAFTKGFAAADRAQALRTFAAGGYYSVSLPAPLKRTRLLVLDDVFMSRRYQTCSGKEDPAPAVAQIAWLEQQLRLARSKNQKVWVMAHIPPGVDPYSTATKGENICGGGKPTMFLSSEALPETLARFGDVIRLAIFAHTHMDEVRLLQPSAGDAMPGVAVKMIPSISPINGNNPSFTLAAIDPTTSAIRDYRVIAASSKSGDDAKWSQEYDFEQTYHEPGFSAATVHNLLGRFSADRNAETGFSQSYIRNYDVGQPVRKLGPLWPLYVCALENDAAAAFQSCVCGK